MLFAYFGPAESRYCEIEAEDVSPETEERDTKRVAKKLTVKGEIGIAGLAKAQIEYVKENCTHEVKDDGAATARGSVTVGKDGCGLVRGTAGEIKIRGGMGSVLVICAESEASYDIVGWKAAIVDGETIKANVWYTLKDGDFVEVDET